MRSAAAGTTSERGTRRGGQPPSRGPGSPQAAAVASHRGLEPSPSPSGCRAAAYLAASRLDGRDAGLIAGLAAIWLTAIARKAVTGAVPGLLVISAAVLTVQTAVVLATGELWLFLLQFPITNLCMCVLFARTASGPRPLIAQLAAEVVALRQPVIHHPGLHRFFQAATWLWAGIFLLLTAGLAALMVTEPAGLFMMLSTAATIALVVAGAAASALWPRPPTRRRAPRLAPCQRQAASAASGPSGCQPRPAPAPGHRERRRMPPRVAIRPASRLSFPRESPRPHVTSYAGRRRHARHPGSSRGRRPRESETATPVLAIGAARCLRRVTHSPDRDDRPARRRRLQRRGGPGGTGRAA